MEWIGRQWAKAAAAARQLDAPWLAAAVTLGVAYGLMPLPGAVVGVGAEFWGEEVGCEVGCERLWFEPDGGGDGDSRGGGSGVVW